MKLIWKDEPEATRLYLLSGSLLKDVRAVVREVACVKKRSKGWQIYPPKTVDGYTYAAYAPEPEYYATKQEAQAIAVALFRLGDT